MMTFFAGIVIYFYAAFNKLMESYIVETLVSLYNDEPHGETVLRALGYGALGFVDIVRLLGVPAHRAMMTLACMEDDGHIRPERVFWTDTGRYKLTRKGRELLRDHIHADDIADCIAYLQ